MLMLDLLGTRVSSIDVPSTATLVTSLCVVARAVAAIVARAVAATVTGAVGIAVARAVVLPLAGAVARAEGKISTGTNLEILKGKDVKMTVDTTNIPPKPVLQVGASAFAGAQVSAMLGVDFQLCQRKVGAKQLGECAEGRGGLRQRPFADRCGVVRRYGLDAPMEGVVDALQYLGHALLLETGKRGQQDEEGEQQQIEAEQPDHPIVARRPGRGRLRRPLDCSFAAVTLHGGVDSLLP